MPQAVWIGTLSFGLVNIPVKLYSATSPKQVKFHHYEADTGRRIRYARVATGPASDDVSGPLVEVPSPPAEDEVPPEAPRVAPDVETPRDGADYEPVDDAGDEAGDEREVEWDEVVKGVEVEPGRVVTVTHEELASVAPERSRVLEIEQFVAREDIDPVHFDKTYYVVPASDRGAARPYWLLHRAMEAAGKMAVGRFVMRRREYLVTVRAGEHVLMLETMFYADEVRDPKEVWVPSIDEPPERELRLAREFVEALTGPWEPERRRDEHRERLLELLDSKSGDAFTVPDVDEEPAPSPAVDLMKALEASVAAAKEARA
jgi:DNA end-binding protein Ku